MSRKKTPKADPAHVVAYVRVSTGEQAASGLGLDAQRATIAAEADRRGWTIVAWCEDAGASAKSMAKRPGLAEALGAIEAGTAAGIVVAKLDRLSRSLVDFAGLMARPAGLGPRGSTRRRLDASAASSPTYGVRGRNARSSAPRT
jgi:hypothetical protein